MSSPGSFRSPMSRLTPACRDSAPGPFAADSSAAEWRVSKDSSREGNAVTASETAIARLPPAR